ncbi:MAG: transcriptional repressor LexA [Anaerolineae bacterium]|nr:transcriptional repressor LexA [Anaerolineae bacterium]MDW8068599.1 transcriptional repressor LexA [Anaerolineae bacterium]
MNALLERLTERQRRILETVRDFIHERGYPPTVREIGQRVGIASTSHIKYHLDRLEEVGLIQRDPRSSRGIRLTVAGERTVGFGEIVAIPLVGVIQAGQPIPVPASDFSLLGIEETIELTRGILGDTRDLYALRVQGNSMIDALVHDGDIVVMRRVEEVENGEMAAVWLRDREEATLKRVYREGSRVRLQPANPNMAPIYIDDPRQVQIQGKVVMVIRRVG